jgi:hypothetical protein
MQLVNAVFGLPQLRPELPVRASIPLGGSYEALAR